MSLPELVVSSPSSALGVPGCVVCGIKLILLIGSVVRSLIGNQITDAGVATLADVLPRTKLTVLT